MLTPRRHGIRVFAYHLAEMVVLVGAFFLSYDLRRRTGAYWVMDIEPLPTVLWLLPAMLAIWAPLLWIFRSYEQFRGRSAWMHGALALGTSVSGVIILFALVAILKRSSDVNRSLIGLMGVASCLGLIAVRLIAMAFVSHYTLKGYDRHYVVIGGSGPEALQLAEYLEDMRGAVYQVRGFVAEEAMPADSQLGRWKILGRWEDLPDVAAKIPVDEVFLLPRGGPLDGRMDLIRRCETMGMSVHLRLSPFENTISRLELVEAAGGDYLRFTTAPRNGMTLLAKRVGDVVGALLLLMASSPLLLLVMALIRLTSRGPSIFRQERAGMNGRVFTLYKLRTMVDGAEKGREKLEALNELDGPAFKLKNDPRVTRLGKFLRRTSIDELPQLWNVVKGDMSLVGPRPLPVYEVEKLAPWQRRRMTMRPGITCLWQVRGRNRVTNFDEWIRLDLEYVDRWSLGLDFRILLRTIPAVLGGKGAY
jgi:exopolysaccharide biosynthesis polyprenyl glycosylphosphotransferase